MTVNLSPLRVGRITGSRVPKILGLSQYGTADDVLREMVRQHFGEPDEFTGSVATEHGNDSEPLAIADYEMATGNVVHGAQVFVVHPAHPFLGVSPDGLVGDAGMVEVKAPYRATYTTIAERPDYYAQVQLQLACTGRRWCDFAVWREAEPLIPETVPADPAWLPSVLPTLGAFMRLYTETIADPALTQIHLEPLVADREDVAWQVAAAEVLRAVEAERTAKEAAEDAKDALKKLAGGKASRGFGVAVTARRGSISWAAAVKAAGGLDGVDPENFRSKGGWAVTQS